ncbi:MAG: molybdenum cofactor guanylyltransferase [Nitrospiraceae bacterium]|nr:MAG: molybdenum cofactor guanylyltransferase [Nitrospiraceae bacterium]
MTAFINDCTGAILAGGENTRMPLLKSFIEVGGQKIIERNIGTTRPLFKEYFIVTNQPEYYSALGVPLLGDVYDERGPMTGIFTVLLNASNSWVFISACDMPFLNKDLIGYMAMKRAGKDAVVPVSGGNSEPLFAFYSRQLTDKMEKALLSGNKSLRDFLRNKRVQYITTEETGKIDTHAASFVNLNSPDDIERYLQKSDITRFKRSLKGR